jgi:hypothetical protein
VQNVSDDGKKVRRRQAFTEKHKEELQVRHADADMQYVVVNKQHTQLI